VTLLQLVEQMSRTWKFHPLFIHFISFYFKTRNVWISINLLYMAVVIAVTWSRQLPVLGDMRVWTSCPKTSRSSAVTGKSNPQHLSYYYCINTWQVQDDNKLQSDGRWQTYTTLHNKTFHWLDNWHAHSHVPWQYQLNTPYETTALHNDRFIGLARSFARWEHRAPYNEAGENSK